MTIKIRTPFEPPRHVFACLVQYIAMGAHSLPIEGPWTYGGLVVCDTPEQKRLGLERAMTHLEEVDETTTSRTATASTRKLSAPEIRQVLFSLEKMPAGLSPALLETAFNLLSRLDVDHLPWHTTGTTTDKEKIRQAETILPDADNIMMVYHGAQTAQAIQAQCQANIGGPTDLYALHTRLQQLESPLRYFMLLPEEGNILPVWRPYPPYPANKTERPVAALPLVGTEQLTDKQSAAFLTTQFSLLAQLDKKTTAHIISPDGLPCLLATELLTALPQPPKTAALLRA